MTVQGIWPMVSADQYTEDRRSAGNMSIACTQCGAALGVTRDCRVCLQYRNAFYRDSRGNLPRYRVKAWRVPNEDKAPWGVARRRAPPLDPALRRVFDLLQPISLLPPPYTRPRKEWP